MLLYLKIIIIYMLKIVVSPLFSSVLDYCNVFNYIIINPYNPSINDMNILKNSDLLILAYGYKEKLKYNYNGKIIEFKSTTFDDLISNI